MTTQTMSPARLTLVRAINALETTRDQLYEQAGDQETADAERIRLHADDVADTVDRLRRDLDRMRNAQPYELPMVPTTRSDMWITLRLMLGWGAIVAVVVYGPAAIKLLIAMHR